MSSELGITIWGVEHGSAGFADCPNGKTIMLDAGSSEDFSPAIHLSTTRNVGKNGTPLDHLIISHPDQDHISDLPFIMDLMPPKVLHRNRTIPSSLIYRGLDTDAKKTYKALDSRYVHDVAPENELHPEENLGGVRCVTRSLNAATYPDLGEGGSANNYSMVTVFRYHEFAVIFPGDIEEAGMEILMDTTNLMGEIIKAPARVLIAPHHGRKRGVCTSFLSQVEPVLTIMSDKWGTETTDYDTYRRYSRGWNVYVNADVERKEIVTTKHNRPVLVAIQPGTLIVRTMKG